MGAIADGFLAYMEAFVEGITPDPDLWIDEWADEFMVIPKKAGAAEPGKYRGARTPYAAEVARCLSPAHPCRTVVVMGASQMLKTQTGLNFIAASIHQAPANMLVLLPTLNITKRVSSRIAAVIEEVPELKQRVAEPRSRDARNTGDTKEFDGGTLYINTAGSASNLAEIAARYVWGDEVDRWEANVGGEGDPVDLADNRRSTFEYNSKGYYTSSPTLKGTSRIAKLHAEGDQRRYFVPCPHCEHMHTLEWENVRWNETETMAWLVCAECGSMIDEGHKTRMLAAGEWRATAEAKDSRIVSFQISALYMPAGWTSWLSLAKQFVKAKKALDRGDHEAMQVFYNTRLALVYDTAAEMVKWEVLKARAERYSLRTIPAGCVTLTAAVDTQPSWLQLTIMGWGLGLERWVIDRQILWGSPAEDKVWEDLDQILRAPILNAYGIPLSVAATCIDTGGHNTQDVYNFVRPRKYRKVMAIKGASKPGRPIIASRPSAMDLNWRGRVEKQGVELWFVGTDTAKDWMANRWLLTDGPGAIHFSEDLDDDFYKQITAERRVTKYRKGRAFSEWVKDNGARNEDLDTLVYNLAAAYSIGLHKRRDHEWQKIRATLEPATGDLFSQPSSPVHTSAQDASPTQSNAPAVRPASPAQHLAAGGRPQPAPSLGVGSSEWSSRL